MKKSILVTLFFTAIFATSFKCKKDIIPPDNPYGLPNATQTGENIFAYLKNGVPKIVRKSIYTMGAGIKNDTLGITGTAGGTNYFESIGIGITGDLAQLRTYDINSNKIIIEFTTNISCISSNITKSSAVSGSIFLSRVDTNNKIISGLFNCKIPIPNCDTLAITEGRFDIKY